MPARILVLEPDPAIAEVFETFLTEEGYEVIVDLTPSTTLVAIAHLHPALIIMDYFPGFGTSPASIRFLEALRRQATTRTLPVIVCTTASPAHTAIVDALHHPSVRVVHKPFTLDELTVALDRGQRAPLSPPP